MYEFSCGPVHYLARRDDSEQLQIFAADREADLFRGTRVPDERILEGAGLVFLATEDARPEDLRAFRDFFASQPYFNDAEWLPFVASAWTVSFDASWMNLNHANRQHYATVHAIDRAEWLAPPTFTDTQATFQVRTIMTKNTLGLTLPALSVDLTTQVFGRGVGFSHVDSSYTFGHRRFFEQKLFTMNSYCPNAWGGTRIFVASAIRDPKARHRNPGLRALTRFAHREFVRANQEDMDFIEAYLPSASEVPATEKLAPELAQMVGYLQQF